MVLTQFHSFAVYWSGITLFLWLPDKIDGGPGNYRGRRCCYNITAGSNDLIKFQSGRNTCCMRSFLPGWYMVRPAFIQ